jgi:hypothetical protein
LPALRVGASSIGCMIGWCSDFRNQKSEIRNQERHQERLQF